ncbi:High-affinity branched-chain amino acid transport system permease protein LivH [Methylorubrum aminovorans]|uniref:High-affinity branched-chain amino acid transport system permease protein LivH n=1 Tax=Methylorubrum aminovorans TaxID=269069 RepID=A0ABQ4ULG3_9HYPH|nr:branched-chain amino acid ABC transporter permease [Methylorubrum aminovorans]GJE67177.1 High-affinity branched-chain amino acid transport system permease protein LivH [Methylorubrum aminovorans]GMA75566.1 branched-chain amino acid ABC transporter permease [Methylorubrum aminovorans]
MLTGTLVSGLGLGSMYGLVALGFHITFAVSGTVNFAQGSAVTLGAVLGYAFAVQLGWPMPLAAAAALAGCALLGLAVERLLVRPFVTRGSDAWLLATVAGGIILDNVLLFTFGKEPRSLPSPLVSAPVQILGAGIYPLQLLIPVVGVAAAVAIRTVFRRTELGRVLLAVAQNAEAARLMGIDVARTVACAFALSAVLAGAAGLLIAPLFSVSAEMGALFGIKAFAVAILGGIGSATGVVLAGLLYGLVEAGVTATLGSGATQIVVFSVIILALAIRPNGLLGRAAVNKV